MLDRLRQRSLPPCRSSSAGLDLFLRFMKRVAILGATGSIGDQHAGRDRTAPGSLSASEILSRSIAACAGFGGAFAGGFVPRPAPLSPTMALEADLHCIAHCSAEGLPTSKSTAAARRTHRSVPRRIPAVDVVVAAIVGAAGHRAPVWPRREAGKHLLLANKEAVVMAGSLMMDAALRRRRRPNLIPLD